MLRPGTLRRKKEGNGQPEGYAIKSKTGRPRVANPDLVSGNAAGHNNSNLTSQATSVVNDGWELLHGIVPIIVFIPPQTPVTNYINHPGPKLTKDQKDTVVRAPSPAFAFFRSAMAGNACAQYPTTPARN